MTMRMIANGRLTPRERAGSAGFGASVDVAGSAVGVVSVDGAVESSLVDVLVVSVAVVVVTGVVSTTGGASVLVTGTGTGTGVMGTGCGFG